MIEAKNNFTGGLDFDTSNHVFPKNSYRAALNVTRDASEAGNDVAITNIQSNRGVEYTFPSIGVVIGRVGNQLRNTEIFFRYSIDGYDGIYELDLTTRAITKIFECLTDSTTNILNFTISGKILNANIYNRPEGDLLYFLDSQGRPTYLNIDRFKAGEYTPVTRDMITVIKRPPLNTISTYYYENIADRGNNLRNKLFKFQVIWVYDDYEESCPGPESPMPLPVNILTDTYTNIVTNNNAITIVLESGAKNVKFIKLLMSYSEKSNLWSDFVVVETIDKAKNGYADDSTFNYRFFNDGVYPTYELSRRIQLYDYVPDNAVSQEMPNGNVVCYGGITEGRERALDPDVEVNVLTVAAGSGGGGSGSLSVLVTDVFPGKRAVFSGSPATGTVINIKIENDATHVISTPVTYTTLAGDTADDVGTALHINIGGVISVTGFGVDANKITIIVDDDYSYNTIEILAPGGSPDANSSATFPFSTERRLGLAYFDLNGVTNGILYSTNVTFPAYAENGSQQVLLPYIDLIINHTPPEWAYSYQVLLTKENTKFVYWYTQGVNTDESQFIYFDVTNMVLNADKKPTTAAVLEWTFLDGDRLRLIRRASDDTVFDDTYDASILGIVVDPMINSVAKTGTFIKIPKFAPFDAVDYTSNEFVIQLYRPQIQGATAGTQTYYECGVQFPIINPTQAERFHGGGVTNQSLGIPAETYIYSGDAYFRARTVVVSETGVATYFVQDRNFVDIYISAVNNIDGRPNVIDENAKPAFFSAMIRHGEEYQANTNINGINRFPATNFIDCDYSQGTIGRMKVRDRSLRIFQQYKVGNSPLFSQINKQSNGGNVAVTTDILLNPVQYYQGNNGIGDAYESLASYNDFDYFADNFRGKICRVASNGVEQISEIFRVNSWAETELPLRTGEFKIYGTHDPKSNNYILSLEAASGSPAQTISFSEKMKSFESMLSFTPEMFGTVGTLLISYLEGDVYTHDDTTYNTFYGVSYDSYVTAIFNDAALSKKQFMSITELANRKWDCPEIISQMESFGTTYQQTNLKLAEFTKLEGMYSASIKRDVNSRGGKINGDMMKGAFISVKFRVENAVNLSVLNIVSLKYIQSPLNVQ